MTNESAVFWHVIDELGTRDYQPLVHVPGSHQDTYADVSDRCETRQLTIDGWYPDALGFTAVAVRKPTAFRRVEEARQLDVTLNHTGNQSHGSRSGR